MDLFSIRNLAGGGTSIDELRRAVAVAEGEHLVLLQGTDSEVRWPGLCPNCGEAAEQKLKITRGFSLFVPSGDDTPNSWQPEVDSFEVPFCRVCLRQRETELKPPSRWLPLRRVMSDGEGFAGLVVLAIAGLFWKEAVFRLSFTPLAMGFFPMGIGYWLVRQTWQRTAPMGVTAPTSVDLAVDFTPAMNLEREPGWRAFQFRKESYAVAFRRENAARIWEQEGEAARSALLARKKESWRTHWVVGGLIVAFLIWQFFFGK